MRAKAQDIVAATSIVDRRNLFYGSVAVELANGEKLYYHSILNADGLAVNIERWKHQQLVKQLNKAQKSSLDKAEDNEYVNEKAADSCNADDKIWIIKQTIKENRFWKERLIFYYLF